MAGAAVGLEVGIVWRVAYNLRGSSFLSAGLSVFRHLPTRSLLPDLRGTKFVVHLLWVADNEDAKG